MSRGRLPVTLISTLAVALWWQSQAFALGGVLDPTFSSDGLLTAGSPLFNESANSIAIQGNDGKVVIAGGAERLFTDGTHKTFAVAR